MFELYKGSNVKVSVLLKADQCSWVGDEILSLSGGHLNINFKSLFRRGCNSCSNNGCGELEG